MKMIQIVVVFLSLFVMLGGLALPLYWNVIQPYVSSIPGYVETMLRNITSFIGMVRGTS